MSFVSNLGPIFRNCFQVLWIYIEKAKYSSVIICLNCLLPSVRTVYFDDEIL